MARASRLLWLALALLAGCASGPALDTRGVDLGMTPHDAVAGARVFRGRNVLWGGTIITADNLPDSTRFEVLAYPLDGDQRPLTERPPLGRFLLLSRGYLETADYAPGRRLTIRGHLAGTRDGRVGKAVYTYPVVEAQKIYLWPRRLPGAQPQVHFGFGVVFGH